MNVAMVCQGFSTTNTNLQPWKYFYMIAKEMATQGHQVTILSPKGQTTDIYRLTPHDDRYGVVLNMEGAINTVEMTSYFRLKKLSIMVVSIGPFTFLRDLLPREANLIRIGVITYPVHRWGDLIRFAPSALITDFEHTYALTMGSLIAPFTIRALCEKLDHIICESRANTEELRRLGLDGRRVSLVPPGVDMEFLDTESHPLERGNSDRRCMRTVTYFGSAMPTRGPQDLVRAFDSIAQRFPDTELRLFIRPDQGTNRYIRELGRTVENRDRVSMTVKHMPMSELAGHLRQSSVVVFPFRMVPSEMPVGPFEALGMSCRIVVPRIGGLSDLGEAGATLYTPGDVNDLAEKIGTTLTSTLNRTSHRKVFVRSWRETAEAFEQCLKEQCPLRMNS